MPLSGVNLPIRHGKFPRKFSKKIFTALFFCENFEKNQNITLYLECEREMVCLECSLFFSRRFCVKCVRKNKSEFPKELNKDISKLETNYAEVKRIKKAAEIERCSKS
jgi:hypothetical protein